MCVTYKKILFLRKLKICFKTTSGIFSVCVRWSSCLLKQFSIFSFIIAGTLHLAIFIRRDLIWYVTTSEDSSLSVRPGTAFRTKGAVATSFMLFGTSFLFVTAHLTAHQEKVKERVSDVKKIAHSLDLPRVLPCKNKNRGIYYF